MHRSREEQRLMPYFITGACLVACLVLAVSAPSLHDWWHRHHAHGLQCAHLQRSPAAEQPRASASGSPPFVLGGGYRLWCERTGD